MTGRATEKFKHFELMHGMFLDNGASVITDPRNVQSTEGAVNRPARRNHQIHHARDTYRQESLALQREAIDLERRKIELLERLLSN